MKTHPIIALAAVLFLFSGCKATLEQGGPYAPEGQEGDLAFYVVEGAFDIAYATIDGAFKFERDNRVKLWTFNPQIKRTLDKIRPEAAKVVIQYATARRAYMTHATAAELTDLHVVLAKIQQLAATALSVIPKE